MVGIESLESKLRQQVSQRAFAEAIETGMNIVRLDAKNRTAHYNLGIAYLELQDESKAIEHYDLLSIYHGVNAGILCNRAAALTVMGRYQEALRNYYEALELSPDLSAIHYGMSCVLLKLGDYAAGFKKHEFRWLTIQKGQHPFPMERRWKGQEIKDKTLLIWTEQGYGDAIAFIRYAIIIRPMVGRLIIACPPALLRLFCSLPGDFMVVHLNQSLRSGYDFHIPILSIPAAVGIFPDQNPVTMPYFLPARNAQLLPRSDRKLNIGIAWRTKPAPEPWRSIPFHLLQPLLQIPHCRYFHLDVSPITDITSEYATIVECHEWISDFADTASYIQEMDLIITADTALAHLAGALNQQTWVLLPKFSNWRWQRNGMLTHPWYPSMRLFWQSRWRNWETAVSDVRQALLDVVEHHWVKSS